ncbi:hypothetical protein ACTXG7_08310 [Mycolicibacterium sp. Dal123E01]|uniref:hypothetical protein n=1 Tax=Mycolicibacterium sp. Dal123E01 TaxID=3457578 RepID=UPI00403E3F88
MTTMLTAPFAALVVTATVSACGGALGPTATSTPAPSPASSIPKDVVPQSQHQAQDTLLGYLQRTVKGLPSGITLDSSRFGGVGAGNVGCDDNATGPDAPTRFNVAFDLKVPPNTDNAELIQAFGDVWRGWGWSVYERDGFRKPNLFGFGPDGYQLRLVSAARQGLPPGLEGSTPCFPGHLARNDTAFPTVVTP